MASQARRPDGEDPVSLGRNHRLAGQKRTHLAWEPSQARRLDREDPVSLGRPHQGTGPRAVAQLQRTTCRLCAAAFQVIIVGREEGPKGQHGGRPEVAPEGKSLLKKRSRCLRGFHTFSISTWVIRPKPGGRKEGTKVNATTRTEGRAAGSCCFKKMTDAAYPGTATNASTLGSGGRRIKSSRRDSATTESVQGQPGLTEFLSLKVEKKMTVDYFRQP